MTSENALEHDSKSEIITTVRDGIAYATVNRPGARNAMTSTMFDTLLTFLGQINDDRNVRVLLLQATGQNFIAGGDVKAFAAGLDTTPEERAQDMKTRAARAGRVCIEIARIRQPVIVAARGYVIGAGLSMLAAGDLALVSDTAQLILAHVSLGMSPDGAASYFLPRHVGLKRAKQMALLGDVVSPQEALASGLVNWVVPDSELDGRAQALAARLAAAPATALAEIKALFNASFERDLDAQVGAENESLGRTALTEDFAEALRAIRGKRRPKFGLSG